MNVEGKIRHDVATYSRHACVDGGREVAYNVEENTRGQRKKEIPFAFYRIWCMPRRG